MASSGWFFGEALGGGAGCSSQGENEEHEARRAELYKRHLTVDDTSMNRRTSPDGATLDAGTHSCPCTC